MSRICAIYSLKTFFIAFAMLFSVNYADPAEAGESNLYGAINNFRWEEFEDDGSRLLKESGLLYSLGFTHRIEYVNHLTLQPLVEIFGGVVDYDGQACDIITGGGCQPAATEVDYFGFKLQGELGGRLDFPRAVFIEPFAGLGIRFWLRDINDGTTADGEPTAGYVEQWFTFHTRLGFRAGKDFSGRSQLFTEAGVKIPLYNQNKAYLSDAGLGSDVTLKPGKRVSYFAEAGMRINKFKGSVFYDGLRFSESDLVASGMNFYLQPESTMDIFGIKLGMIF